MLIVVYTRQIVLSPTLTVVHPVITRGTRSVSKGIILTYTLFLWGREESQTQTCVATTNLLPGSTRTFELFRFLPVNLGQ